MIEAAFAELEIGLHRWNIDAYSVEMRFNQPGPDSEVDQKVFRGVRFDFDALRVLALDPAAYGQHLTDSLFADPTARTAFALACARAEEQGVDLRLRLFVGPSAPELHGLRWETLRDPRSETNHGTGAWLVSSERILFSRYLSGLGYLSGQGWKRARLRPRADLSALVVIANPVGLGEWQPDDRPLPPLDVAGEQARAEAGLAGLQFTTLASNGTATLTNLVDGLRDGCDVLYLVCHGAVIEGEPRLWLEDETGTVAVVSGSELVARLRDLPQLPRLAVLASCQSAGTGDDARANDDGALVALGPRLAEVGVPAVLAMQGNVTMRTLETFLPIFFEELRRDGQIDRAMAAARGAVRMREDAWMPVLFLRARTGRVWYAPGFTDRRGFQRWPVLIDCILHQHCTPILGPGMHESLLGSHREIAQRWAQDFGFPMAPDDRDDLPQVAQYIAVDQAAVFPPSALEDYLRREMVARYGAYLPPTLRNDPDAPLLDLIAAVGARRRERDPADPHQVLAGLPFPLFVTTSPGNLLAEALRAAGKAPRTELCRWKQDLELIPSVDDEPTYTPDPQRPLVYHAFGHFDRLDSLVLTEDDHFDYLIGVSRNQDLIPSAVNTALTNRALLFLGFQVDDWSFRVLFRAILSQEGGAARRKYAHVAVQVDPEDDRIVNPERARRYLEDYLHEEDVSVYWGTAEDFVKELQQQLQRRRPVAAGSP